MHPAQQFRAPSSIQTGVALKEIINPELVQLIGVSLRNVYAKFPLARFKKHANEGLNELELAARGRHIGMAMADCLPSNFSEAMEILLASMGPELTQTEGNGLAPFFYMPHASMVAEHGVNDLKLGMRGNYEITKRFSAEFSVRPFLIKHRDACLEILLRWTSDPNAHVRRLCSEGTRPRLPWAMRLKEFQQDPNFTLPILDRLKDDSEQYVRRSVANHLADLLKDHPDVIYRLCHRWLEEVNRRSISPIIADHRKWIIRHAVRLPAKKGDARASQLRQMAK